jgi:nucleoside-diphosphate-sugar epimerase
MKETVLVTGATGYIGSWVVKYLLEDGHTVRIPVRDKAKVEKYQHLLAIEQATEGSLEVYAGDLLEEGSYDSPAVGADSILHIASPFAYQVRDAQSDLVDPAVKGTRNVLVAASKSGTVKKVVLTSSVAAVYGDNVDMQTQGISEFDESYFNTTSSLTHQPYPYSKVAAEKMAWDIFSQQDKWQLVVINPAFVMGPPLVKTANSESVAFMKDLLSGKLFFGVPELSIGFVDVRDVARAHLLAMNKDDAEGRYILAERTISFMEFAMVVKKHYGGKYKLPFMTTPKFMLYLIGWAFGLTNAFISKNVGYPLKLNSTKSRDNLHLTYTPFDDTVVDMIEAMRAQHLVK